MIKYKHQRFKSGAIQFRVCSSFATSIIPETFSLIPYKIVYVKGEELPLHIFNCTLNFLSTLISISGIKLVPQLQCQLTHSELRFLLSRVIEGAESLAGSANKGKVVISTAIGAIVDIFVEKDYVFSERTHLGFRGIKQLIPKIHKGSVNEANQD